MRAFLQLMHAIVIGPLMMLFFLAHVYAAGSNTSSSGLSSGRILRSKVGSASNPFSTSMFGSLSSLSLE